ncbi:MAG TPA: hypothetical protein VEB22_08910 [Phycisphaerales bacterium]|nr:hypothetical protein [Phycisphaerales bacterium]
MFREMGGMNVLLKLPLTMAMMFLIGFAAGGPTVGWRVAVGLGAAALLPVLIVFLIVGSHFYLKARYGRMFGEMEQAKQQLERMTPNEVRAAAEAALSGTPYFLSFPATGSPDSDLPSGAAEFFERYDRVDFVQAGNASPYVSVCRSLIGPVPLNHDALKIGEAYIADSCVAVHLRTGRVTVHHPPIGAGEVARCGELRGLRYDSVWHLIAGLAAAQRIGDAHGFKPFPRQAQLDKRPLWRAAGGTS